MSFSREGVCSSDLDTLTLGVLILDLLLSFGALVLDRFLAQKLRHTSIRYAVQLSKLPSSYDLHFSPLIRREMANHQIEGCRKRPQYAAVFGGVGPVKPRHKVRALPIFR